MLQHERRITCRLVCWKGLEQRHYHQARGEVSNISTPDPHEWVDGASVGVMLDTIQVRDWSLSWECRTKRHAGLGILLEGVKQHEVQDRRCSKCTCNMMLGVEPIGSFYRVSRCCCEYSSKAEPFPHIIQIGPCHLNPKTLNPQTPNPSTPKCHEPQVLKP